MKVILVGLGHEMHGDDEIGLEIVRRWSAENMGKYPGLNIQTSVLESPGINLLGQIAGLDAAILVAAVRSGAPPGTVRILKDQEMADFEGSRGKPRRWGAAETLSLGRQMAPEYLPEQLIMISIEGTAFGLGEGLSPAVRAAIPDALKALDQALKELAGRRNALTVLIKQIISVLHKVFAGGSQGDH